MTVIERFKSWRLWSAVSQAQVASRIGCSQVLISYIERGERRPNVDVAVAIERETQDWPDGPILVSEWVRQETDSSDVAAAPNEAA